MRQEINRDRPVDIAAEPAIDIAQPEANSTSQKVRKKFRLPPVITAAFARVRDDGLVLDGDQPGP